MIPDGGFPFLIPLGALDNSPILIRYQTKMKGELMSRRNCFQHGSGLIIGRADESYSPENAKKSVARPRPSVKQWWHFRNSADLP